MKLGHLFFIFQTSRLKDIDDIKSEKKNLKYNFYLNFGSLVPRSGDASHQILKPFEIHFYGRISPQSKSLILCCLLPHNSEEINASSPELYSRSALSRRFWKHKYTRRNQLESPATRRRAGQLSPDFPPRRIDYMDSMWHRVLANLVA